MNGRRAGLAFGAGLLASLPLLLWNLGPGGEPTLLLYVAPASGLSLLLLMVLWRRLGWQPGNRTAWSGVWLLASVLGAVLTGALTALFVVLIQVPGLRGFDGRALPGLLGAGALTGLSFGFLTLSAPLGGLLFVLLMGQKPERPKSPASPARYTSPHD